MNIIYLERQLRAGRSPESLGGVVVGSGAQKKAYRIGNVVVKENTGAWCKADEKRPPKGISAYGARFVRQYRAGKYVLQEFVTPLCSQREGENNGNCNYDGKWNIEKGSAVYNQWKLLNRQWGEMHQYNCGIDANGKLVVFDW